MAGRRPSKGNQLNRQKGRNRSPYIGKQYREGRPTKDSPLWVHRYLSGESIKLLEAVSKQFDPHQAIRKPVDHSITIGYPSEIRRAIAQSEKDVPDMTMHHKIRELMPPSFHEPAVARALGLGQLGGQIVLKVMYDSFAEEHFELTNGINEYLGIEFEWRDPIPHVTLAVGGLNKVTNQAQIMSFVPPAIVLGGGFEKP